MSAIPDSVRRELLSHFESLIDQLESNTPLLQKLHDLLQPWQQVTCSEVIALQLEMAEALRTQRITLLDFDGDWTLMNDAFIHTEEVRKKYEQASERLASVTGLRHA